MSNGRRMTVRMVRDHGSETRVKLLLESIAWIDKQFENLSIANAAPAMVKALLAEKREYCKQVAHECGEWDARGVPANVVRTLAANLPKLTQEDLEQLTAIRAKLEGTA